MIPSAKLSGKEMRHLRAQRIHDGDIGIPRARRGECELGRLREGVGVGEDVLSY
jgi:hypothetical protein